MAEAFIRVLLQNLNSLIQDEIGLIIGVDKEMKKLFSIFTTIEAVLQDAEEKKLKNKAIENWVCKLKDLAFEIDDILDECATHFSKQKLRKSKLSPCEILFRFKMAGSIKKVTKKLDDVADERTKFHLCEISAVERSREVDVTRVTSSILNESHQVYGRDADKEKIVEILLNGVGENQRISVLPIIGVGGLGKTTLAQSLYNDQQVVDHFEKRLWVCVSDNFDQETLVRAMIESATMSGSASDLKQLDTLQKRLQELLNGKRYLLVLDDVWSEDQEKWSVLKNVLSCGSNGTSIIVTTRLKMVADIMGTLPPHYLDGLSEEYCWMLMRERAFGEEEKDKYPNLEVIGKQIVKKCSGVPMAAKALEGLLRFKKTEKEWIYVKESELLNLPQEETLILPALRLSYHHLPLELRQCFAYFAIFPKGLGIRKRDLIFHWMAQGYISSKGILEVEDVGNEICNQLLLRSLFQYDPVDTDAIMMHDLVHDLAQSIMENKVPGVQVERQVSNTSNTKTRQVKMRQYLLEFPPSTQYDMDISSILTKFSHLRVLDTSHLVIMNLPSKVGNLKHLRFLNLSHSDFRTLPNSLCSIWNLQTLNLNECWSLIALPRNMRRLKNLRHLCMERCNSLRGMPSRIGEITCLKTLNLFIVGNNSGNQLEELQHLNLGGRLEIKHLERVRSYKDSEKANLYEKRELRHLSFKWKSNKSSCKSRADIDEKVLEALQPYPNLETLSIKGFGGRGFPGWMTSSVLGKIVRMDMMDCPHCLHLPELGKLPHLEFLRLGEVGVEYIIEDEIAVDTLFPSLKTLVLYSLPHLKGLLKEQVSTQVFPNLTKLLILSCSSLVFSGLQLSSLQELEIRDCGGLMPTSFAKMNALTSLKVEFGEKMKSIPMEMLEKFSNLETLIVIKAEEESLPEEGMRALKSLTRLWISSETMRCLPVGIFKTAQS